MNNQQPNTNTALEVSDDTPYIFLAEDDVDDQELLIEALTQHAASLKIHTAINGKKAAQHLEDLADAALPCLIIVDYNLPEVDGAELLEILSLNERFKTIPIVVWSTSNSPHYKQICLSRGARQYFVKPNDITGIYKVAKEMLAYCGM